MIKIILKWLSRKINSILIVFWKYNTLLQVLSAPSFLSLSLSLSLSGTIALTEGLLSWV